ncbi:MAG: hypothetical protein RLZZ196_1143 [Bacteroidota bacterium]
MATAAVIAASVTPAFASAPAASLGAAPTPYGQFGCLQRAQNKLFSIGATSINPSSSGVWAFLNNETTIGIWCRGSEAIISVSGENASIIRDELRNTF